MIACSFNFLTYVYGSKISIFLVVKARKILRDSKSMVKEVEYPVARSGVSAPQELRDSHFRSFRF